MRPSDSCSRIEPIEKSLHAASARLFAEALANNPKLADDRQDQHRYNAACAAALAGCGQGKDEPAPSDDAKTKLRRQAREWLQAELAAWTRILDSGTPDMKAKIAPTLKHWQSDADLAGIRDEKALAKLPETERNDNRALWSAVDDLLRKATGSSTPATTEEDLAPPGQAPSIRSPRYPLPESPNLPKMRPLIRETILGELICRCQISARSRGAQPEWSPSSIAIEGFVVPSLDRSDRPGQSELAIQRAGRRIARSATASSSAWATAWSSTGWFRRSSSGRQARKRLTSPPPAASTLLTYCLLRRALDSGARAEALIVNAKPAVLLGGPEFNARSWQEVLSLRDALELLQITRNAPFVCLDTRRPSAPIAASAARDPVRRHGRDSGRDRRASARSIPSSGGTGPSTAGQTSPRPYRLTAAS